VIFWSLVICHLAFLTGCGDDQANSPVIASGFIEGEEVRIASEVGGTIAEIAVSEGDEVEAGQVLVRLDDALLQTRRGEALAAVTAAEANLARVRAGARSAELSAARAVLAEAQARRDGALTALEHARRELRNPQELNSLIVEAETQVALAEQEVERARADVGRAEFLYEVYADGDGDAERTRSLEVEAARAALEGAQARMEGALRYLSMLNAIRDEPLELEAQVHAAEAEFNAAEAVVAVAQASVEELEAGSTPEEIELAQAQLHQARASLTLIEAQMAQLTITSPITGMVTSRSTHAGETAAPGTTLLTLANLDQVTLVIYVPEAQVGHVRVGQPVEVAADSFPERAFVGTVTTIAGEAEFTPRNVQTREERVNLVFAVKVVIPNPDHALKPGMTADAVIRP
jgi:multidrug resistance efflux pump